MSYSDLPSGNNTSYRTHLWSGWESYAYDFDERIIDPHSTMKCNTPGVWRVANGRQADDIPKGRKLLKRLEKPSNRPALVMDRACEDDETRKLAVDLGFNPVVPPKSSRIAPWEYDRNMYRRRNGVERLFRRLKGFRRIFSRFDRLDVMYLGFVVFALVIDALRSVNNPWCFTG